MNLKLTDLKPLTIDQYEACRRRALERVGERIGAKPSRAQFQRELGPLTTVLDAIALIVFLPALAISSVHIIAHMGKLAESSYNAALQAGAGTVLSRDFYVAAHQWAVIPLAEGSMILFLVMFGMQRAGWRRWVYLILSLLAGVFVLVANWQSGIGVLESLLAPAFTIGIGLKLEHLIVQLLRRRESVNNRYLEALAIYETATTDATQHPDYLPILRHEIWQKLTSLKANLAYADAPTGFKHLAVRRELAREQWAYAEAEPIAEFTSELEAEPAKPAIVPFGNTVPDLAPVDLASMPMSKRANGRGGESIAVKEV